MPGPRNWKWREGESMPGMIEVIVGGMYSGKTEELIRRLRRARFGKKGVLLFKPKIDDRYSETDVVSHVRNKFPAVPVSTTEEMEGYFQEDTEVIGIDEAQFIPDLRPFCHRMANLGKRVVVAGLDMDWRGEPFGDMPALMATAEKVTKLRAICMVCGGDAGFTYKRKGSQNQVEIGGADVYEARCRRCFSS